jgi:hypothetical protein
METVANIKRPASAGLNLVEAKLLENTWTSSSDGSLILKSETEGKGRQLNFRIFEPLLNNLPDRDPRGVPVRTGAAQG